MRRTLLILFISTAACLHQGRAQVTDEVRDLEPQLQEAFQDMRRRDPEAYEAVRVGLLEDPETARWYIMEHARYLAEMREAQRNHPEKYRQMLEQESAEKQVRQLIDRLHTAVPQSHDHEDIVARMRSQLNAWFEIRQRMRALEMETFAKEIATERGLMKEAQDHQEAARNAWLERVTEGGREAMLARAEEYRRGDDLDIVAPLLLDVITRHDPESAHHLKLLADRQPEAFRRRLHEITMDSPELLDIARRTGAEKLTLHATLRERLTRAHALLIPMVGESSIVIPADRKDEVNAVLQTVVDAEIAITRDNIADAQRSLARSREVFEERKPLKSVIVDIQLSRLVGDESLYEW